MKRILKGIKRGAETFMKVSKECVKGISKIFVDKETRAVAGMTIVGIGAGLAVLGGSLIVSAYIKLPQ